ncbi:GNAT family N-acetyltransferase [Ponticoccus sp. (in: a-proteobacteria)]|uniref:GNAT family N-acetyltransferase n=1 Tax=Ponticoccus sp. (in: a-proteobacteria) TaxID=1925025 RepID=UPI003AB528A0
MSAPWTLDPVTDADAAVDDLLARHHADMRAGSPPESCHVMTASALRAAGAQVYALRDEAGAVCAVGALKPLTDGPLPGPAVELKSMHVARACRGRGLGGILLRHLLGRAREGGATSACLETGTQDAFLPARELYAGAGFTECPPFADYRLDPLSVFMMRRL